MLHSLRQPRSTPSCDDGIETKAWPCCTHEGFCALNTERVVHGYPPWESGSGSPGRGAFNTHSGVTPSYMVTRAFIAFLSRHTVTWHLHRSRDGGGRNFL